MLQMRVYSERTSMANGIETSIGEDAYPFVNNVGMFVADGMGGGAGVPILKFDERCFNGSALSRMLCDYFKFNSVTSEEDFCTYIKDNFSSLSNSVMEELYKNPKGNILRLKKSGYVGSHALGAAFAAMLIHLSTSVKCLDLDYSLWKEKVEEIKDNVFEHYKKVITLLGPECARVNIDKINYYGTTLAGVLFKENIDSVDAIFLNCGDSRSYVWDSNGFRQACDDQGRNGGMTSLFSLGKDVKVQISCEIRNYKKPCSILCMTDGFYGVFGGKNGFHSTPLYMEGFLMNVLSTHSSIENAATRLKTVFDTKGQIDDSNSMVMASFGYSTYEELREAAKTRLDYINCEYCLDSMPEDFLLVDYNKIVTDLKEASAESIKPLLEEAYNDENIHLYCIDQINQPVHAGKYKQEVRLIEEKLADISDANFDLRKKMYMVVTENFTDFVDVGDVQQTIVDRCIKIITKSRPKEARSYGQSFSYDWQKRKSAIDALVEGLTKLNSTIISEVDSIVVDVKAPWTKQIEEENLTWVKTQKDYITEMLRDSQDSLSRIAEYSRLISTDLDQWKQINIKLMNDYLDKGGLFTPQKIIDNWIGNYLEIEDACIDTTIPSIRFDIIRLVKEYQSNIELIEKLNIEHNRATEKAARKYWDDNSHIDIHMLLKSDMYLSTNPSLKQKIIDIFSQNEELVKYECLNQKQAEIFGQYMRKHLSETSDDKKADVAKNGWM